MADAELLTHAFMRAHPAEAARVLEAVTAAEAAALFARVPARLGAPVLAAMFPGAAARTLGTLEDERAMELLGAAGVQPTIAVLRHIGEPRRSRLIAGLPTASALASKLLLGYPEDSVGAWTDPAVIALAPGTRARDALERARSVETDVDCVYVVDAERRLVGWVALAVLLRAPESAPLDSLAQRAEAILGASATLAGALAHPGWERTSRMPVVESGDRLIGALTRDALTRALARTARVARDSGPGTVSGALARGYWEALSGIVEATTALLPRVAPLKEGNDEH